MNIQSSIHFYRLLLHLYPRTFLQEYGAALEQGFRDLAHQHLRERGRLGLATLWLVIIPDLAKSLLMEHLPREGDLTVRKFQLQWIAACAIGTIFGGWSRTALRDLFIEAIFRGPGLLRIALIMLVSISTGLILGLIQALVMRRKPLEMIRWMLAIGFAYMVGRRLFDALVQIPHSRAIAVALPLVLTGLSILMSRTAVHAIARSIQRKSRSFRAVLGIGLITFAVFAALDADNVLYGLILRLGTAPEVFPGFTILDHGFTGLLLGLLTTAPAYWVSRSGIERIPQPE
jgi:hypothetical protein